MDENAGCTIVLCVFGWHIDFGGASGYCSATPRAALDAARTTTNTEGSADA